MICNDCENEITQEDPVFCPHCGFQVGQTEYGDVYWSDNQFKEIGKFIANLFPLDEEAREIAINTFENQMACLDCEIGRKRKVIEDATEQRAKKLEKNLKDMIDG